MWLNLGVFSKTQAALKSSVNAFLYFDFYQIHCRE